MSEQDFNELMRRIKNRREELGLSYQDVANLTGISKSTLQRYETGNIKNFPVGKLPDLARALQTTEAALTGWGEDERKSPAIENDPLAGKLFAAYGKVKKEFTQEEIDDITMMMEVIAERKRQKREREKDGK